MIDDCDEHLAAYKWHADYDDHTKSFYVKHDVTLVSGKSKCVRIHNAIIGQSLKGMVVDHIDGNPLNNTRENLRFVTMRDNCANHWRRRTGLTSSKYLGVCWDKAKGKWKAHTKIKGKTIFLGRFISELDAKEARNNFVKTLIGAVLLLVFSCFNIFANPPNSPAGVPILNQHQYQQHSEMNIDTATIRIFSNTPSLPTGIIIDGSLYNSAIGSANVNGDFYSTTHTYTVRQIFNSPKFIWPDGYSQITETYRNARDYAATGDGTTDDTAALQAAINASTTTLYIPAGNYKISSSLNLHSHMTIVGDGKSTKIFTNVQYGLSMFNIANATATVIKGIYFYGNAVLIDTDTPVIGIHISRCENLEITGNFFENLNYDIHFDDSGSGSYNNHGSDIHDNHFYNAYGLSWGGYGILHVRSYGDTIHDNVFYPGPFDRHCIYMSVGTRETVVHNNVMTGAHLGAIAMNAGTTGEGVKNNVVSGNKINGAGTYIANSYAITMSGDITYTNVTNNVILNASEACVFAQANDATHLPSNLLISGNVCQDSQGGMAFSDLSNSIISNNMFTNDALGGSVHEISVTNTSAISQKNFITGNLSTTGSPSRNFVYFGAGTLNNYSSVNISTAMTQDRVMDDGTNLIFENNGGYQAIAANTASTSIDGSKGTSIFMTVSATTTIAPSTYGNLKGQPLDIVIIQNGVGGKGISWNGNFKQNWSDTGNTAAKVSSIRFVFDGTNYYQVGSQLAYH